VALKSDREHAWISEQVLRDWPSLTSEAWWQDGLSNMIAAVTKIRLDRCGQSLDPRPYRHRAVTAGACRTD